MPLPLVVPMATAALMAMFLMSRPTWSGLTGGPETAAASTQPERALLVAMDDHLERSELLLVEVMMLRMMMILFLVEMMKELFHFHWMHLTIHFRTMHF